jgi:hypothetical protein
MTPLEYDKAARKHLKACRRLTDKKLTAYITRNPGLTAAMMGKLLRHKYGTISAALYWLVKKKLIRRIEGVGERGSNVKAWRYHPNEPARHRHL